MTNSERYEAICKAYNDFLKVVLDLTHEDAEPCVVLLWQPGNPSMRLNCGMPPKVLMRIVEEYDGGRK